MSTFWFQSLPPCALPVHTHVFTPAKNASGRFCHDASFANAAPSELLSLQPFRRTCTTFYEMGLKHWHSHDSIEKRGCHNRSCSFTFRLSSWCQPPAGLLCSLPSSNACFSCLLLFSTRQKGKAFRLHCGYYFSHWLLQQQQRRNQNEVSNDHLSGNEEYPKERTSSWQWSYKTS